MVQMTTIECTLIAYILFHIDIRAQDTRVSDQAHTALEYVENIRHQTCSGGSGTTLPVHFDHTVWVHHAEVALRMSNTLSKILARNNNSLSSIPEALLYDLVRVNVDNDSPIFGSAIGLEEWTYPTYRLFAPYAYKPRNDVTRSHDLAVNYDILDPSSEWYHVLRMRNWTGAHVTENIITYRYNETAFSGEGEVMLREPLADLDDGHWTLPYYDCGGGEIWMVTYSAPILGVDHAGYPVFMGVATIDIELTDIDINQCDLEEGHEEERSEGRIDVFRGTHHCLSTTKCTPVSGPGFIPGAYICTCLHGFYFPEPQLPEQQKHFPGSQLEAIFNNMTKTTGNASEDQVTGYRCLACAEGCETCVDGAPCLYGYKLPMRASLLALSLLTLLIPVLASVIVKVNSTRKVIKSASPIFLHVMSVGAALMVLTMLLSYVQPTDVLCVLKPWIRHVGFSLAYGALLLKTWRIAAIFRVKSAQKMHLSDKVLAQRFIPILSVPIAYLTVWTIVNRSQVIWLTTAVDGLKFQFCQTSWWDYGAVVGEGLFLLWGAYLCFVVRKAPSNYNESKYITWSIYNNILLGSFIIIAKEFIAMEYGPDIIYAVEFAYIQVVVTGLMCLIFLPKAYSVYRGAPDEESKNDTFPRTNTTHISHSTHADDTSGRKNATTQTSQIDRASLNNKGNDRDKLPRLLSVSKNKIRPCQNTQQ